MLRLAALLLCATSVTGLAQQIPSLRRPTQTEPITNDLGQLEGRQRLGSAGGQFAAAQLVLAGYEGLEMLLRASRVGSDERRLDAATGLGADGSDLALSRLAQMLGDAAPLVQLEAQHGLKMAGPRANGYLVQAAISDNAVGANTAVWMLSANKGGEPFIRSIATMPQANGRATALDVMWRADPANFELALAAMGDSRGDVRRAALELLMRQHDSPAKSQALDRIARTGTLAQRIALASYGTDVAHTKAPDYYVVLLEDRDPRVRRVAAVLPARNFFWSLGKPASAGFLHKVIELLRDPDRQVREITVDSMAEYVTNKGYGYKPVDVVALIGQDDATLLIKRLRSVQLPGGHAAVSALIHFFEP